MGTNPLRGAFPLPYFLGPFLKNLAKVHYLYFCYTLDKIVICTCDLKIVLLSNFPIMPYAHQEAYETQ